MPPDDCRKRFTAKVLQPVRNLAEVWFKDGSHGITFHNPLAAARIFEPDICRYKQGSVKVSLNEPTAGWTVFQEQAAGPHTVAAEVDSRRFFEYYFSVVKQGIAPRRRDRRHDPPPPAAKATDHLGKRKKRTSP